MGKFENPIPQVVIELLRLFQLKKVACVRHKRYIVVSKSPVYLNIRAVGQRRYGTDFAILSQLAKNARISNKEMAAAVPEVRNVFLVSGHFDLIAHVAVRDMEHLKQVSSERLHQPFIIRVETSVIFNRITNHEIPILESPRTDAKTRNEPQFKRHG